MLSHAANPVRPFKSFGTGKRHLIPNKKSFFRTAIHSTVTDFARFRGLSTSVPRMTAA
jgi:hypothetical protein